jgi:hypothetical protein
MLRALLVLFVVLNIVFMSTAQVSQTCPGALPSRLVVGGEAVVIPGLANNVRQNPGLSAAKIGQIPAGGRFRVLDGPVCANGYAWWKVDYNGIIGWTAESGDGAYWLEMIANPLPTSMPRATAAPTTQARNLGPSTAAVSSSAVEAVRLDATMPLFVEDFRDNRHGWFQIYENGLYFQVKDGLYTMQAYQGAQQVADTHAIAEFGLEPLTVYAISVDFLSLSNDPLNHCPAIVLNYNHRTSDTSRLRRIEFCNQSIVSMHNWERSVDSTVRSTIDATDGNVHRFGVISDGQTLFAHIDGEIITSIPYDLPLETISLSVIDYGYRSGEMFQDVHVIWDNLTISVPITCPYTVSIQIESLEIVNSVESDPGFTTTFVGGDEALIGYGISAVQTGRQATDYGFNDAYYLSWSGNVYQGSRVLNFPMLSRVVSCEQDVVAYIALQESDVFFAKNLGVVPIPFSPDMSSPQTVTESVSGITIDSDYDYQVTYTISAAAGAQTAVDRTQVNMSQVRIDNDQAIMVAPVGSGSSSDTSTVDTYYNTSTACELTYDRGLSISLSEDEAKSSGGGYFVTCGFNAQAGDTVAIESSHGHRVLYSDLTLVEASNGTYTLEESGVYLVIVTLEPQTQSATPQDEPIYERVCDANGVCQDILVGTERGSARETVVLNGYVRVRRLP